MPQVHHTLVAIFAITCLTYLGDQKNMDVAQPIMMVAIGIAGSGAAEGIWKKHD